MRQRAFLLASIFPNIFPSCSNYEFRGKLSYVENISA